VAPPSTSNHNDDDNAKALHDPNSEIKLHAQKMLLFNTPEAGHLHCKTILTPYLNKHYTKPEEMLEQMDTLDNQKITRLILIPGELERWAKEHGAYPKSLRKQSKRQIEQLRTIDTETSYVVQYSKRNSKDLMAHDALLSIYCDDVVHSIANSFHCNFGMEYVHIPSSDESIWDPDGIPDGLLDDAFIVNATKEKCKDTLKFQFKVITRV
jgi:hypothetical protein